MRSLHRHQSRLGRHSPVRSEKVGPFSQTPRGPGEEGKHATRNSVQGQARPHLRQPQPRPYGDHQGTGVSDTRLQLALNPRERGQEGEKGAPGGDVRQVEQCLDIMGNDIGKHAFSAPLQYFLQTSLNQICRFHLRAEGCRFKERRHLRAEGCRFKERRRHLPLWQ